MTPKLSRLLAILAALALLASACGDDDEAVPSSSVWAARSGCRVAVGRPRYGAAPVSPRST
jgi:hypothetical protein